MRRKYSSLSIEYAFISKALAALLKLREESDIRVLEYLERLVRENGLKAQPFIALGASRATRLAKKLCSTATHVSSFLKKLPFYVSQYHRLKRIADQSKIVVVATSSGRLASTQSTLGPREYLSRLVQDSFTDVLATSSHAQEVINADYLFIFEPEKDSPAWRRKDSFWAEGIFILDSNFLTFLIFVAVIKLRLTYPIFCIRHWREFQYIQCEDYRNPKAFKLMFITSLIMQAYEEVLSDKESIRSLFLTSNSFTTELLRFYLMVSQNCEEVCEVMHGISTTYWDRYYRHILEAAASYDSYRKHTFIAQLPMVPLSGVLDDRFQCDIRIAINTYLNRFILENTSRHTSLDTLIEKQVRSLFNSVMPLDDHTILIAYLGGYSVEKDFLESGLFEIEKCIMRQVCESFESLGLPYYILYSPHPMYCFEQIKAHTFFLDKKIIPYPNSVFTWMVSEFTFGTFSGAMFEANYFGSKTFAPLRSSDDIYPESVLTLVRHCNENGSQLSEDIKQFIVSEVKRPRQSLEARVRSRVNKLNSAQSMISLQPKPFLVNQNLIEAY